VWSLQAGEILLSRMSEAGLEEPQKDDLFLVSELSARRHYDSPFGVGLSAQYAQGGETELGIYEFEQLSYILNEVPYESSRC
jgi:hypothetical protein